MPDMNQPNSQTIQQMLQTSRQSVATQGNNPQGPMGVTNPNDPNIEQRVNQQVAQANLQASNPANINTGQNNPAMPGRTGMQENGAGMGGQIPGSMPGLIANQMMAQRRS